LGWTFITPEVHPTGTDIVDTKVHVKMQCGPGTSLTGGTLWNALMNGITSTVELSGYMSSSEEFTDPERRKRIIEQKE
jgi:hypothetical protein